MFRSVFSKIIIFFIIVILAVGALAVTRTPAEATPGSVGDFGNAAAMPVSLDWPADGQAAIGASGYGLLAVHGDQTPVSIASVSKIITALAVLQKKPLSVGDQGPMITITQEDFDSYNNYYLEGGSVARVAVGEQISEYQALQGALLPSANNLADTLARWAFGSIDAYSAYADKMVGSMGLSHTTVGSASGFDDKTLSTAADLTHIGQAALDNPVLAQIVKEETATIPAAGTVRNVNWLLGANGVIGIKTGNTDQAGGCFLFAAQHKIAGQSVTMVGAVLAAPTLNASIADSRVLLASIDKNFRMVQVAKRGEGILTYRTPWNETAEAIADKDVSLLAWNGDALKLKKDLHAVGVPSAKGTYVGSTTIYSEDKSVTVPLVLTSPIHGPSLTWRLKN
ncbi:MAG TPA: hypothetical protein VG964_02200, partial [Candidatus Saccharimonadales bacterium]|nr:hypothetical protein [Candidatus Saccharimonadales bacterium]